MGFPRGYTMSLLMKVPQDEQQQREGEVLRCAAIVNTLPVNTLAGLFGMVLSYASMKKEKGAQKIIVDLVASLGVPPEPAFPKGEAPLQAGSVLLGQEDDTLSLVGNEVLEQLKALGEGLPTEKALLEQGKSLSTRLVSAFIRRQEMRGSDVRLDTVLCKSGEPKSYANYTLAAIQHFRPQVKQHLPWSWKLVKV